MLRSAAPRSAFRTASLSAQLSTRTALLSIKAISRVQPRTSALPNGRITALACPLNMSLVRFQSSTPPMQDKIDHKHEREVGHHKLSAHPELVSSTSSTHPIVGEIGTEDKEENVDMMAGVKSDLKTIRETFSLQEVPREAIYVGMAGVIPYLGTSLSTIYCAWEINHSATTGSGFLINERTAELLLHVLEPLQVGYGAVIISFLGAIHWGLEWAGYGGTKGYPRYAIGVVAPAVAWPTILLPVETALIVQFLAFNFLYYADSRATKRGWAPPWYAVYRFVLTFIVGSTIVASLIGRGHVGDRITKAPGAADRIRALREAQEGELIKEEDARRNRVVEVEESEDEEEGQDDE